MKHARISFAFLALLSAVASGRDFPVPAASPSAFADTESVTNAPIASAPNTRVFRGRIALTASPSNNVEVAFGLAENGELPFGAEAFAVGWDRGAWFLASQSKRYESVTLDKTAPRHLSFEIRVGEDGLPRTWNVETPGVAFTNLPARPPAWVFSRDWTTARLAVRGIDKRDENVSVVLDSDPWLLILR